MSEKRLKFTLESDRQYIGIFDEGYALTGFEVCNFLNSLYQQCEELQEENEQLRKIGVMYQGHNPCEICTYCLENKVCCAESIPISCADAKNNFIQGLCKKHKQIRKSIRRYNDE